MSPNLRIALRFLIAKKRSMIMSLAGIVFGVGFFIVTQAQTTGFEEFFIKTILGTDGAIRIEDRFQEPPQGIVSGKDSSFVIVNRDTRRYVEGVEEPRMIRNALKNFGNVAAISEIVQGSVLIASPLRNSTAQIYGINLEDHLGASDLRHQITLGDLSAFRKDPTGLLIGKALAEQLQVTIGDSVTLGVTSSLLEDQGSKQRFRVSAIYETGVNDIDKVRVYVHMSEARSLLHKPFGASLMQINVFDRDRAQEDAARMTEVLNYRVTSWQYRQRVWLGVFTVLRVSSFITVCTIILISGLGMFNTLTMIVLEKTREISILRSMGYTRSDISRIFLWQGVIVLTAGTIIGWIAGAGMTFALSRVPIHIRGIFNTDTFIVAWSIWHYIAAAATASIIVMIASLWPARRAARLEPGDVIRGTAS